MKRVIIIKLLLFVAAFCFGQTQTNGNFANLDVRNRSTFRGPHYIYDSTYFKPYSVNVPLLATGQPLGWFLTTTKGAEAKLVRVTIENLADSLGPFMPQYWSLSGDDIENNNAGKVILPGDSTFFDAIPGEATKVGRILHVNQYGEIEWTSPATLKDTLEVLMPQYWTYVDAATDTLYNNSPPEDSLGVVLFKHPIELLPTTATTGQIKQNGSTVFHTYSDGDDENLFIGKYVGNFTMTGNVNLGIGYYSSCNLTSGQYNTGIGNYTLSSTTQDNFNTAIGAFSQRYGSIGSSYNTSIGSLSLQKSNQGNNVAVGYNCMGDGSGTYSANSGLGNLALSNLDSGYYNVGIGFSALRDNEDGNFNTAIGSNSLLNNKGNSGSVALGYQAMQYADSRDPGRTTYNTAVGYEAMKGSSTAANNTGQYNTAVGYRALDAMTSGEKNSVYGVDAGGGITTGSGNVLIGYSSGSALTTESNKLYIENSNSATPLIYGDFAADSLVINGDLTVTGLDSASTAYGLYYDKSTGEITYDSVAGGDDVWYLDNDTAKTDYHVVVDSSFSMQYNGFYLGYNSSGPDNPFVALSYNNKLPLIDSVMVVSGIMKTNGLPYLFNHMTNVYNVNSLLDLSTIAPIPSKAISIASDYWINHLFFEPYTGQLKITDEISDVTNTILYDTALISITRNDNDTVSGIKITTGDVGIYGDIFAYGIDSASTDYGLYYNKSTGLITYDSAGSGGVADSYWDEADDTLTADYHVKVDSSFIMEYDSVYLGYSDYPAYPEHGMIEGIKQEYKSGDTVSFFAVGEYPGVDGVGILIYSGFTDGNELSTPHSMFQTKYSGDGNEPVLNILVDDGTYSSEIYVTPDSVKISGTKIILDGELVASETDPVWLSDSATYISKSQARSDIHDSIAANSQGFLTALPASALEWSDTTASAGIGIATFDDIRDTAAAIRADFPTGGWVGTATSDLDMDGYNLDACDSATVEDLISNNHILTTSLADHGSSGFKISLTAAANVAIGDVCYINSSSKMALVDADAIASSSGLFMAAESISGDAAGMFIIGPAVVRDDTWNWTPGELIYITVTGTTGNTLSQSAPTGTDDVVQIVGVALTADVMLFNPQLVQIELN